MHINIQPIEKRIAFHDGESLQVHSIFYTIQGEGPFTGKPAIFVRLAGCNLQCPGCDTEYTEGRKDSEVANIVDFVSSIAEKLFFKPLVVITGGEPFRQNILPLCQKLNNKRFIVQIETNGTLDPGQAFIDYYSTQQYCRHPTFIVCSPKTGKVASGFREICKHYKYVMSHDSVDPKDGLPTLALHHTASPRVARPDVPQEIKIYLQPMDSQDEATNALNLASVVKSCMTYGYILQLQTHKLIGVA
jgi:7-carboxy-7-deazaguanine synthase